MSIKKMMLGLSLFSLAHTQPIAASSYHDMRTQGLIYLGVILGAFGANQVTKRSENNWRTFTDMASGITLLAAGIVTIALSGQLVHDLDHLLK